MSAPSAVTAHLSPSQIEQGLKQLTAFAQTDFKGGCLGRHHVVLVTGDEGKRLEVMSNWEIVIHTVILFVTCRFCEIGNFWDSIDNKYSILPLLDKLIDEIASHSRFPSSWAEKINLNREYLFPDTPKSMKPMPQLPILPPPQPLPTPESAPISVAIPPPPEPLAPSPEAQPQQQLPSFPTPAPIQFQPRPTESNSAHVKVILTNASDPRTLSRIARREKREEMNGNHTTAIARKEIFDIFNTNTGRPIGFPLAVIKNLFQFFNEKDFVACLRVSKKWKEPLECKGINMWRLLVVRDFANQSLQREPYIFVDRVLSQDRQQLRNCLSIQLSKEDDAELGMLLHIEAFKKAYELLFSYNRPVITFNGQIQIKLVNGRNFFLSVKPGDSIRTIQQAIHDREGIRSSDCSILYKGARLNEGRRIRAMQSGDIVYHVSRARGATPTQESSTTTKPADKKKLLP